MDKLKNHQKGISLIELLIAVTVIGTLITIAVPAYQKAKEKAGQVEAKQSLSSLYTHQRVFISNWGYGTPHMIQLGFVPVGIFTYNVGIRGMNKMRTPSSFINVNTPTRPTGLEVPYRGPLASGGKTALFNICHYQVLGVPVVKRTGAKCTWITQSGVALPLKVKKSAIGESGTGETYIRTENTRYKQVDFKFAAGKVKLGQENDYWIINKRKQLYNVHKNELAIHLSP